MEYPERVQHFFSLTQQAGLRVSEVRGLGQEPTERDWIWSYADRFLELEMQDLHTKVASAIQTYADKLQNLLILSITVPRKIASRHGTPLGLDPNLKLPKLVSISLT